MGILMEISKRQSWSSTLDWIEVRIQLHANPITSLTGTKFKEYFFNEHKPHELLRILQRVAKPSKAALRQLLEADFERLEIGPKRLGVETWLNLHAKILTKLEVCRPR
ncbi:hypothetical protein V8E54_006623 [Elaphomyces granulatus]